jgi:hypothetical protein
MSSKRNRETEEERGDQGLAARAKPQGGLISVHQLGELGISKRAAVHRNDVGRLHRVHRGVYAVGHEAIGRNGRLRAAVLACGEGAVLSHGSAAALWGLRDHWPHLIDVTVPCEAGRKLPGIRPHRCRYPDPEEIDVHKDVRCTTPSRTMVDFAGSLALESTRRMVERAAVLKLLDIAAIDAALHRAAGRRGVPALRAVLEDWRTGGSQASNVRSLFEARLLPLIVAADLPYPQCNAVEHLEGQRFELDFLWEAQRLVVETDGEGSHGTPIAFRRDRQRDQILIAAGYRVARVAWDHMTKEPDITVARIRRMLGKPG